MRTSQILGVALVALGLAIMANLLPLFTLVVDTSPPQLTGVQPVEGGVYKSLGSIGDFRVRAVDKESGVASVVATLKAASFTMALVSGDAYDGVWSDLYSFSDYFGSLPDGSYTVSYQSANKAGLSSTLTVNFKIDSWVTLQGDWYCNDRKVASGDTLYATSRTVSFKFVKTGGSASESDITCTVSWSGPASGSVTLQRTAANTWTGSVTFTADGKYTINCKAVDTRGGSVAASIVGLQVGGEKPEIGVNQILGGVVALLGVALALRRR
jgi:major membrane immunogen (membrane-anchored lipoprotein)